MSLVKVLGRVGVSLLITKQATLALGGGVGRPGGGDGVLRGRPRRRMGLELSRRGASRSAC